MNAALLSAALPRQPFIFIAMTGTAPWPFACNFCEKCFNWVLLGITDGLFQVRFISNERVIIVFLPKRTTAAKQLICPAGGFAFPVIDQLSKRYAPNVHD